MAHWKRTQPANPQAAKPAIRDVEYWGKTSSWNDHHAVVRCHGFWAGFWWNFRVFQGFWGFLVELLRFQGFQGVFFRGGCFLWILRDFKGLSRGFLRFQGLSGLSGVFGFSRAFWKWRVSCEAFLGLFRGYILLILGFFLHRVQDVGSFLMKFCAFSHGLYRYQGFMFFLWF